MTTATRTSERPHGVRAKYVHEGCRCTECRKACSEYEKRRVRRNAYGLNPWVDAEAARQHIRSLMSSAVGVNDGMSWRRIAKKAGVQQSTVCRILYGRFGNRPEDPAKRIHKDTEAKLLEVKRDLADGALVDAGLTWHMIEEMLGFGVTKSRISRALGSKSPKLQLSRDRITVKNARKVERLHWSLFKASAQFRRACGCPMPDHVAEWIDEIESSTSRRKRAGLA